MLNPEFKARWVKVLRSGEFAQTIGSYTHLEGSGVRCFCALGVAGHLATEEDRKAGRLRYRNDSLLKANGELAYLSAWLFSSKVGMDAELFNSITRLNDGEGRTFDEIADYLETLP